MTLKKLCSYGSCHKVVNGNKRFCERHRKLFERDEKVRYKEYKKRRLKDKEKKKQQEFYISKGWQRTRSGVISSCYSIDIYQYYTTGDVVEGQAVHHIVELDDDWSRRQDILNLIYLTEQNHRQIHSEYNISSGKKRTMQNILINMLVRFEEEFK